MTLDPGMPLVPELALFALAVVVLLTGLLQRPASGQPDAGGSGSVLGWLTLVGFAVVFGLTLVTREGTLFGGSFVQDSLAVFAKRLFLGASAVSVLGSLTMTQRAYRLRSAEYYFALIASVLGMFVLASAREFVVLFVAFELMSMPLYLMTGFLKRETVASEAALKFFLVGTASSALILYGMSFVYGVTQTTALAAIPAAMATHNPLVLLGMTLMLAGISFKLAVFPFHMWAPDTYEAGSTPFIAWLSVAPKAAGFVALIRLYVEGAGDTALVWVPVFSTMAGMTIVVGNLLAIPQTNIKRMLAYSGVAHIGYMLLGLAALTTNGIGMVLFYLVAYLFGNMGAFLIVETVAQSTQSNNIDAYRGLAKRSPLLALSMLVFLLSLGGIPFVAGFWAKLYVFMAAAEQGMYGLVFLGAMLGVVALYYYLQVARSMYIEEADTDAPVPVPGLLGVAIGICMLGVVGVGAYPNPWVSMVLRVAESLFS